MQTAHPHLDVAGDHASVGATLVLFAAAVALAAGSTKLGERLKVPEVLLLLGSGMLVRAVGRSFIDPRSLAVMSRPAADACLSLVGLLIGSHLNREVLSALGMRTLWYLVAFFGCTYFSVSVAAATMFPDLRGYAPFVASIALERSSPEALAGITAQKAKGPLSSATMLTSAIMDCAALVAFVTCNAVLADSGSAALTLGSLALGTAVGSVLTLMVIRGAETYARSTLAGVLGAAAVLTLLHRALHFELLLSAIVAGAVLNFNAPHAMTALLEDNVTPVHVVLFAQAGLRIDVIGMWAHFSPLAVVGLFTVRLAGMYCGTASAAKALSLPHPHWRALGLVTQLAIALSLVTRMHETFPEAAPLADAAAGMVLLNLVAGPPLLVLALKGSGEAGAAEESNRVVP